MVDSHVHFWNYHPVKDAWITDEMQVIRRDFTPEMLSTILRDNGISGCVAVQSDQSETETDFLVAYAERFPFIMGVVGWIDLRAGHLEERLGHYSQQHIIKGWRHIIQAEPAGFLLGDEFKKGIKLVGDHGYTYDILIHHGQLREAVEFAACFPNQKFVLDHLAKPDIRQGRDKEEWRNNLRTMASLGNVYCKLSGMVTEAEWHGWQPDQLTEYIDTVFECFGSDKIMYGSDWPVCILAADYSQVKNIVINYISRLSPEEQKAVMGVNATTFYNL